MSNLADDVDAQEEENNNQDEREGDMDLEVTFSYEEEKEMVTGITVSEVPKVEVAKQILRRNTLCSRSVT